MDNWQGFVEEQKENYVNDVSFSSATSENEFDWDSVDIGLNISTSKRTPKSTSNKSIYGGKVIAGKIKTIDLSDLKDFGIGEESEVVLYLCSDGAYRTHNEYYDMLNKENGIF